MSIFGALEVRVDPWQVEYGAEMTGLGSTAPEASEDEVDIEVERAPGEWAPVAPTAPVAFDQILFVDGVRRVETRIVVNEGGRYIFGAFGSFAVGWVGVTDGEATFGDVLDGRVVATGDSLSLPKIVEVGPGLAYRPVSTAHSDPDGPMKAIHDEMRKTEEALGRQLANQPGVLVVADGPLTFEEPQRGDAVGYIKRIMQLYVSGQQLQTLAALGVGTRTPLFALRASRRFARYAWFLRLAEPRLGDSDFSGIVRLEVAEAVGVEKALALADASAVLLPRFRGVRGLHPRAPQNLLPIGALEERLRRWLGDVELTRRYIETRIAAELSK